ncbi:hypothetical protein [Nocardia cyriacigeorgica]|uniref:hypothetical protein n=1 Tax=Nocardia cyriacigeorgica TaxID=135487 RepID=UPI002455DFCB|nr:hypothetical protein [Nocardia cyriacigeorgica]
MGRLRIPTIRRQILLTAWRDEQAADRTDGHFAALTLGRTRPRNLVRFLREGARLGPFEGTWNPTGPYADRLAALTGDIR